MSEIFSSPSGSSKINSSDLFGNAVPLNFIVSPGLNFKVIGFMRITFDVSIIHEVVFSSLPSEIMALYLPNGASNGTIIGSANFQFPFASAFAVLVLMIFPSGSFTDAVIALFGCAVPEISKKSVLCNISGSPTIVSGMLSDSGILLFGSSNLKLMLFS